MAGREILSSKQISTLIFEGSSIVFNEEEVVMLNYGVNGPPLKKRCLLWVLTQDSRKRNKHFRPPFMEEWMFKYMERDFKLLFRMMPRTFDLFVSKIGPYYHGKLKRGKSALVGANKAILITLYYFAHNDSLVQIANHFSVVDSTVLYEVEYICSILQTKKSMYIRWPILEEIESIRMEFRLRAGFPGVMGAIDGCHIPIIAPSSQQASYTNRKGSQSIVLQGVCTANRQFIDVSVGVPGRRHDASVLKFSELYNVILTEGPLRLFYFQSNHLIGDSAYPVRLWLLPPFKQNRQLTQAQRRYNYRHSCTRIVIGHAFGLLKERWRRLKLLHLRDISKASDYVLAACILHNFCLQENDTWENVNNQEEDIENNGIHVNEFNDEVERLIGIQKMNDIANLF